MQIHELNNFTGTLGSGAYLAIDDGNDTGKISSQGLLAATEARIDNIIAGDAPSAAEVVDARLGADGVTYSSLGTGIRSQFTDVKADITYINGTLFQRGSKIEQDASANFYYLDGTGKCANASGYKMLKYQVTAGDVVWLRADKETDGTFQFQSSSSVPSSLPNSNLIGYPQKVAYDAPITVPQGATWIIISGTSSTPNGLYTFTSLDDKLTEVRTDLESEISSSMETLSGDVSLAKVTAETKTIGGIEYVVNADGTVRAHGTASVNTAYEIPFNVVKSGAYRIAGCPAGGGLTKYYIKVENVDGVDSGNGAVVQLEAFTDYILRLIVYAGETVDITFIPSVIYDGLTVAKAMQNLERIDPILLYGSLSTTTGDVYLGNNYATLTYSSRTNVMFLSKGSKVANDSNENLTLNMLEYRSFDFNTYISQSEFAGTSFEAVVPHDGYYAFAVRKTNYQTGVTPSDFYGWLSFDLYGNKQNTLDITFMDTGSNVSEATFIVFPNGENLLIDSGLKANHTYLRKLIYTKGYKHIDNFILSHYHMDHVGGIIQAVGDGNLTIDSNTNVYVPDQTATQWAYDNNVMEDTSKPLYLEFNQMVSDHNCNVVCPDTEFQNVLIDEAVIMFFNTDLSYYETASTNYNDWSLCNYIFFGNMNACFTGDIGPVAEAHLAGTLFKANVYKAEHHGWANYPTIPNNYIDYVSPDAIFSCDGDVHDELLQTDDAPLERWAEDFCVPYYRTYQNGDINVIMSKDSWRLKSKAKRYIRAHNPISG